MRWAALTRFASAAAACLPLTAAQCVNPEPTSDAALVTFAAFPDTVTAGQQFTMEFAGPIAPNTCGTLDSAYAEVSDSTIVLAGVRNLFRARCADQRVSFYEVNLITIDSPGVREVVNAAGRSFGTLMVADSGSQTDFIGRGGGTVREAGPCLVFGPGWVGTQRIFSLQNAPDPVRNASEDQIVNLRGRFRGFDRCGQWGSRPVIQVDTAWVSDATTHDYYSGNQQ